MPTHPTSRHARAAWATGLLVAGIGILAGCVGTPAPPLHREVRASVHPLTPVGSPAVGEVHRVVVGGTLVRSGHEQLVPAIDLDRGAQVHTMSGGQPQAWRLPPGRYPEWGHDARGRFFARADVLRIGDRVVPGWAGLYVPHDDARQTELCHLVQPPARLRCHARHEVWLARTVDRVPALEAARRELVFVGRRGPRLQLLYREENADRGRPSYSQTIEHDLRTGDLIVFMGARLEVESVSDRALTYRLQRGLAP